MDIKDSYLHGTVGVVKSISVDADKLKYKLADIAGTIREVTLPLVTTTANGLMSSADKIKLDNLSTILGNYVTLNTDQEITGIKTFTKQLKFTVAKGTAPFLVTSNTLVTNLNADYLDGTHKTDLFTEFLNINNTDNPRSVKLLIGDTTKYLLIDYANNAKQIVGLLTGNLENANEWYTNIGILKFRTSISDNTLNIPNSNSWQNALLEIGLHLNGSTAQLYFSKNNPLYYRSNYTNEWKQIAFTDSNITGNASSATKLQTKRKLWGLNFDGTADVSGNMTGVGSISMNGNININCLNDNDRFLIFNTGNTHNWRIGYLGSGSNNANYLSFLSSKTTSSDWISALNIGLINLDATFAGIVNAPTFQGNLDGTYVNKLTNYKIATAIGSIAATDSLNTALGKLEFKTNFIYNDLFGTDNDDVINKWHEIVDFIDSVKEGTDITDEFVTRKTALTITGVKTFAKNTFILAGIENSDIKHATQRAYNWGYYGSTNTPNSVGMYNSLDFCWYNDIWSIGNLRSGGDKTQGFGIGFKKTDTNGNLYFAPALRITSTESYINNNKIWHAGNDGSNSGLDADLLDGKHASDFAITNHTHDLLVQKNMYYIKSETYNWSLTENTWYRIMESDSTSVLDATGDLIIYMNNPGYPSTVKLEFGICYHSEPFINSLWSTSWSGISMIKKARIVYKNPYGNQKAYIEVLAGKTALHTTIFSFKGHGWNFITPVATTESLSESLTNSSNVDIINGNRIINRRLLVLDRLGVGITNPLEKLHINGNICLTGTNPAIYIRNTNTASDTYSIIRFGNSDGNDRAYIFLNGPNRINDGGNNTMTIRNNVGLLRLDNNTSVTGLLTVSYGNTHKGIKVGNSYINAIDGLLIIQNNTAIRFGDDAWNYDVWAGLRYVSSNKTIHLGISDKSIFNGNNILSGGTLNLPGIYHISSTFYNIKVGNIVQLSSSTGGWYTIAQVSDYFNYDLYITGEWYNGMPSTVRVNICNINGTTKITQYSGYIGSNCSLIRLGKVNTDVWDVQLNIIKYPDTIGNQRCIFSGFGGLIVYNTSTVSSTSYSVFNTLTFGQISGISLTTDNYTSYLDKRYYTKTESDNRFVNITGDTMTGILKLKPDLYNDAYNGALDMSNSDIFNLNSIYTADLSNNLAEGIHFYRTATTVDTFRIANGIMYFVPNRTLGSTSSEYIIIHSGNYNSYSPKLDGTGASGTWNININGNASTASRLKPIIVVDSKAFSLSNASWTDTGYTFASLATGTYAVQITFGTTLVASGIMSVYNNLSDTAGDEIPLHVYGTAGWRPYLRTYANKLLISSNDISATSRTITIKIALIL